MKHAEGIWRFSKILPPALSKASSQLPLLTSDIPGPTSPSHLCPHTMTTTPWPSGTWTWVWKRSGLGMYALWHLRAAHANGCPHHWICGATVIGWVTHWRWTSLLPRPRYVVHNGTELVILTGCQIPPPTGCQAAMLHADGGREVEPDKSPCYNPTTLWTGNPTCFWGCALSLQASPWLREHNIK